MVHSLAFSPSGRLLASGLGDGSVSLYGIENNRLVSVARLEEAHSGTTACTVFCEWQPDRVANETTVNDRLLATAGNDGMVVLWDLGIATGSDDVPNPRLLLGGEASATMDALSLEDGQAGPQTICAIDHGLKPNWMVASRQEPVFAQSLFLADTSNDITIYTFPSA